MRTKVLLVVFLVLLSIACQGCFFIYIPTGLIRQAFEETRYCVDTSKQVGSRVAHPDGRMATITEVIGPYSGCRDSARPIGVLVRFDAQTEAKNGQ